MEKSPVLKLQLLQNEFDLVMKQYETTYMNYISDNSSAKDEIISTMQILNNKLLSITNQISQEIDDSSGLVSLEINVKNKQKDKLQNVYSQLMDERKKIDNMLNEYDSLDKKYVDNSTYVQTANYQFMFFFLVTLILIYYIIKMLHL